MTEEKKTIEAMQFLEKVVQRYPSRITLNYGETYTSKGEKVYWIEYVGIWLYEEQRLGEGITLVDALLEAKKDMNRRAIERGHPEAVWE